MPSVRPIAARHIWLLSAWLRAKGDSAQGPGSRDSIPGQSRSIGVVITESPGEPRVRTAVIHRASYRAKAHGLNAIMRTAIDCYLELLQKGTFACACEWFSMRPLIGALQRAWPIPHNFLQIWRTGKSAAASAETNRPSSTDAFGAKFGQVVNGLAALLSWRGCIV